MAAESDKCNPELDIYEDERCKSIDFPCYNRRKRKCVDRENTEEEPTCPPDTIADKYKCNNKWPDFPCYRKKDGACLDSDGTLLVDPIGDIAFGANEAAHGICDLIASLLSDKRIQSSRDVKQRTFELINNYWSLYGEKIKCPKPIIMGEYIRAVPIETYTKLAKSHVDNAKEFISSTLDTWRRTESPDHDAAGVALKHKRRTHKKKQNKNHRRRTKHKKRGHKHHKK